MRVAHATISCMLRRTISVQASRALALLDASPLTESGGLVVAQIHPREHGDLDALALHTLEQYDERKYGSTLLRFYQHQVPDATAGEEEE